MTTTPNYARISYDLAREVARLTAVIDKIRAEAESCEDAARGYVEAGASPLFGNEFYDEGVATTAGRILAVLAAGLAAPVGEARQRRDLLAGYVPDPNQCSACWPITCDEHTPVPALRVGQTP